MPDNFCLRNSYPWNAKYSEVTSLTNLLELQIRAPYKIFNMNYIFIFRNKICEYQVKMKIPTKIVLYAGSIKFQLLSMINVVLVNNFVRNMNTATLFPIFKSSCLSPLQAIITGFGLIQPDLMFPGKELAALFWWLCTKMCNMLPWHFDKKCGWT